MQGIQSIDSIEKIYKVGTLAQIVELQRVPASGVGDTNTDSTDSTTPGDDNLDDAEQYHGKWRVLLQATRRVNLGGTTTEGGPFRADITSVKEESAEEFATTEVAIALQFTISLLFI